MSAVAAAMTAEGVVNIAAVHGKQKIVKLQLK